jgi:hypothetical protein
VRTRARKKTTRRRTARRVYSQLVPNGAGAGTVAMPVSRNDVWKHPY